MRNYLKNRSVAALILVIASQAAGQTRFPGVLQELGSPNGDYTLVNTDSEREPHHSLILRNNKTGAARRLLDYGRSVTVLWSPAGRRIAVTDNFASNESRILILTADGRAPDLSLQDVVGKGLAPPELLRALRENDHVYFEALRWDGEGSLRFRVRGYGASDGSEFSHRYVYSLAAGRILPAAKPLT